VLVGPSVCWSVGWSVCPHITSKTGYIAIASRRGGGRGKVVTSKTDYVAIPSRLGIRWSPCLTTSPWSWNSPEDVMAHMEFLFGAGVVDGHRPLAVGAGQSCNSFLGTCKHLYKRLCRFIGRSVHRSVCPSVPISVWVHFSQPFVNGLIWNLVETFMSICSFSSSSFFLSTTPLTPPSPPSPPPSPQKLNLYTFSELILK
jgi:hypothetical protein